MAQSSLCLWYWSMILCWWQFNCACGWAFNFALHFLRFYWFYFAVLLFDFNFLKFNCYFLICYLKFEVTSYFILDHNYLCLWQPSCYEWLTYICSIGKSHLPSQCSQACWSSVVYWWNHSIWIYPTLQSKVLHCFICLKNSILANFVISLGSSASFWIQQTFRTPVHCRIQSNLAYSLAHPF